MVDSENIRAFVAISIPPELKHEINKLLNLLNKSSTRVKWVNVNSIHITLKFLGNISLTQVEKINSVIKDVARETKQFRLKTGRKGAFPSIKKPRIFWIGFSIAEDNTVFSLQKKIEQEFEAIGFEPEQRKFKPHLTLGRIREQKNMEKTIENFVNYNFPEIDFEVKNILLMQSNLTPHGAIYTVKNSHALV